jgi:chromosome segregation ATPase
LISLKQQVDDLNAKLNDEKENHRKTYDSKDIECKSLRIQNENLKKELENSEKEISQMKTRLDCFKTKEKENQTNFEKTLRELEFDNEKLSSKCAEMNNEIIASEKKMETIKCQLSNYEQLIDSLNEQIIYLKRESKEIQLNFGQINQNYESEREENSKLITKCQHLEKILYEHHQSLAKYQNLDKTLSDTQFKNKQQESLLNARFQ